MSIESQLFTSESWDQVDTLCFQYYECILTKDIGKYKKDSIINTIVIDFEKFKMDFYYEGDITDSFELILSVKE
jgi:hypothetical protein